MAKSSRRKRQWEKENGKEDDDLMGIRKKKKTARKKKRDVPNEEGPGPASQQDLLPLLSSSSSSSSCILHPPILPQIIIPTEGEICSDCLVTAPYDQVILCDACDGEYHALCVDPPLPHGPPEGQWFCTTCTKQQEERIEQTNKRRSSSRKESARKRKGLMIPRPLPTVQVMQKKQGKATKVTKEIQVGSTIECLLCPTTFIKKESTEIVRDIYTLCPSCGSKNSKYRKRYELLIDQAIQDRDRLLAIEAAKPVYVKCTECTVKLNPDENRHPVCGRCLEANERRRVLLWSSIVGKRLLIQNILFTQVDDKEKLWLCGRAIDIDGSNDTHLIHFDDGSKRWMSLWNASFCVAKEVVWFKQRNNMGWWPGQIFESPPGLIEPMEGTFAPLSEFYLVSKFGRHACSWIPKQDVRSFAEVDMECNFFPGKDSTKNTEVYKQRYERKFQIAKVEAKKEDRMVRYTRESSKKSRTDYLRSRIREDYWIGKRTILRRSDSTGVETQFNVQIQQFDPSISKYLLQLTCIPHEEDNDPILEWIDFFDPEISIEIEIMLDRSEHSNDSVVASNETCDWCQFRPMEDPVVVCRTCTRKSHLYCAEPSLQEIPKYYVCQDCTSCVSCHRKSEKEKTFQWQQWLVGMELVTLCPHCFKDYEKGKYCSSCLETWNVSKVGLESRMLYCETCAQWTHADCEKVHTQEEYELVVSGSHSIWGGNYSCISCRTVSMIQVLDELCTDDKLIIFSMPVTIEIAPTYFDIVESPMDLKTMRNNIFSKEYSMPQQLRDDFELLCLNAVLFNGRETRIWREAWRFYKNGLEIFSKHLGDRTTSGKYSSALLETEQKQMPKRVMKPIEGQSSEQEAMVPAAVTELHHHSNEIVEIAPLRATTDLVHDNCLHSTLLLLPRLQATMVAWMDLCMICASSGAIDAPISKLIFCVDCAEGFHPFCVSPPVDPASCPRIREYWRCTNCKICELCGNSTKHDDKKLLMCEVCDRGYHIYCLRPKIKEIPNGTWVCAECVKCTRCGARKQPKGSWSSDIDCCRSCWEKENVDVGKTIGTGVPPHCCCPICTQPWKRDQNLIQCEHCAFWVHPTCDSMDLTEFMSLSLSTAPHMYLCPGCRKPTESSTFIGPSNEAWSVSLLVNDIQKARRTMVKKKESITLQKEKHAIMEKWKTFEFHYRYIIECGETYLKQLAFCSPDKEPSFAGIPRWMITRASRYVRYKSYSRGPCMIEREARKKTETKSITEMISEAMSAASFLAVCHVAYDFPPLSRFGASLLVPRGGIFGNDKRMTSTLAFQYFPCPESDAPMDVSKWISKDAKTWDEEMEVMKKYATQLKKAPKKKKVPGKEKGPLSTTVVAVAESSSDAVPSPVNLLSQASQGILTKQKKEPGVCMTTTESLRGWGTEFTSLGVHEDARRCEFCRKKGDDRVAGRLLGIDSGQWLHINCAHWSNEVYADEYGVLRCWNQALPRSTRTKCAVCSQVGASIGCNTSKCQKVYHYACAKIDEMVFCANKKTFCKLHSDKVGKEDIPVDHKSTEVNRSTIAERGEGLLTDPQRKNVSTQLRIGTLTLHSIGSIAIGHENFQTQNAIYPVGFRSTRIHWSTKVIGKRCVYECEILYNSDLKRGEMPTTAVFDEPCFRITAADDLKNPIYSRSANGTNTIINYFNWSYIKNDTRCIKPTSTTSIGIVSTETRYFSRRFPSVDQPK